MGQVQRIPVPDDAGIGEVDIVGESHYQENLEAICGGRTEEGEERDVEAVLILDDKNRFDPMAVRVEIQGKVVGHLDRQAAREYREWLVEIGHPGVTAIWDAVIRGGWDRGQGDRGHYGVTVYIGPVESEED